MTGRLVDQVALVTGSASGIGRAIAEEFCREGAAVVVADIAPAGADVAAQLNAQGGRAVFASTDATDATQVQAAVQLAQSTFGPVSVLVNNAFYSAGSGVLDTDDESWDATMSGVVKSAFVCTRACLPAMIACGGGAIVNIASVNAVQFMGHDAYSAAKAAMVSLTRSTAVRHGPDGVRANAIAPGTIRTPIWAARIAANPDALTELSSWYPLGRVGEPADVARAALFLASPESAWITGVLLPVDGGLLAGNSGVARLAERGERAR